MAAVEDPSALEQRIADQIRTLLDSYGAAVYRLEEASGALVAVATSGDLGPRFRPGLVFPRGTGIVGLVLLDGRPVTTPNVLSDPRVTLTPDNQALIEQAQYRSVLAVPLLVQGAVIGALSVGAAEGRIFTEAEMTVVQAFADQAAIAIDNARLYQESAAHQRRLATMVEVARKLTSRLDVSAVLDTVAEAAVEVFGAEVGFRLIEGDDLVLSRATPGARQKMVRERLRVGESISGHVAATGEPIATADVPGDPRAVPEHRVADWSNRTDALMCVPIRGGSRILGTLNIYREQGHRFDAAALGLAMSLADQAGVALENARLYQESLEQRRSLATLVEMTRRLTRGLDLATVLGSIAGAAALLFRGEAGFRLVEGDFLVRFGATEGALGAMARERIRLGEAFSGQVALTGEAAVSKDTSADPRQLADHQALLEPKRAGALMCVPIRLGDRILGTLNVYRERGFQFDDEALRLATSFADQAAIAIENARLYTEGARRRREAEELAQVARLLTESLDIATVGRRVVESVLPLFRAASSALYLLQADGSQRAVALGGRAQEHFEAGQVFPPGVGVMGQAVVTRGPVWCRDVLTEPSVVLSDDLRRGIIATGHHATLAVPLRVKGELIGVLSIADEAARAFSAEEVALLQTFADQAALAIDNARLYQQARQAYEALGRAQAELVRMETLRALGELASGAAHHLNNLLAIIVGRIQLLRFRGQAPDIRRPLEIVERAALDSAEVVRRLRAFSRSHPIPTVESVDLNEIAREVVELTRPRWRDEPQARGVGIEVVLDAGELPRVAGDAAALREVLVNLLLNAVEAMPQGGTVTIRTWAIGGWVHCSLSDTGVGMSAEVQGRAIEPFFTTKGVKSTGLGLSVNYGTVRQHGGDLSIESTEGRGTTMTFTLPIRSVVEAAAPTSLPGAPTSRLRILVIDDEPEVRAIMRDLLAEDGHQVIEAAEGMDALTRLENGLRVDVVLTDLGMPGMTGWQVAREIKARWPNLCVALITGWGEETPGTPKEGSAVEVILAKPITQAGLRAAIARLTQTRR